MTFDEAYALDPGAIVAVSDGRPAPPEGSQRWRLWRSHNFSGPIEEKRAGPPRALVIEAVNQAGLRVAYVIQEGLGHTFEASA